MSLPRLLEQVNSVGIALSESRGRPVPSALQLYTKWLLLVSEPCVPIATPTPCFVEMF